MPTIYENFGQSAPPVPAEDQPTGGYPGATVEGANGSETVYVGEGQVTEKKDVHNAPATTTTSTAPKARQSAETTTTTTTAPNLPTREDLEQHSGGAPVVGTGKNIAATGQGEVTSKTTTTIGRPAGGELAHTGSGIDLLAPAVGLLDTGAVLAAAVKNRRKR